MNVVETLIYWTPALAGGFWMNIVISLGAMGIGTVLGLFIGLGRLSPSESLRRVCAGLTHFLRNTPSIVLLFYLAYLLPSQVDLFGLSVPLPGWVKAIIGLSMPVMGFMSDASYGAIRTVPADQWDAAAALPLSKTQTIFGIIMPQTLPMLLPPWVSYFAIIVMASSTAALVGVNEILASATIAMEASPDPALVIPMYFYVLCWFFLFCYPVSRATQLLGRRKWQ